VAGASKEDQVIGLLANNGQDMGTRRIMDMCKPSQFLVMEITFTDRWPREH
jgi:hypothetical protein